MAFRDNQWYINAITQASEVVEQQRAALDRLIQSADYSLASMKCDSLKTALLKLNDLENQMADKQG